MLQQLQEGPLLPPAPPLQEGGGSPKAPLRRMRTFSRHQGVVIQGASSALQLPPPATSLPASARPSHDGEGRPPRVASGTPAAPVTLSRVPSVYGGGVADGGLSLMQLPAVGGSAHAARRSQHSPHLHVRMVGDAPA